VVVDCLGHNQLDGGPGTDLCQFDATQSGAVACEQLSSCS